MGKRKGEIFYKLALVVLGLALVGGLLIPSGQAPEPAQKPAPEVRRPQRPPTQGNTRKPSQTPQKPRKGQQKRTMPLPSHYRAVNTPTEWTVTTNLNDNSAGDTTTGVEDTALINVAGAGIYTRFDLGATPSEVQSVRLVGTFTSGSGDPGLSIKGGDLEDGSDAVEYEASQISDPTFDTVIGFAMAHTHRYWFVEVVTGGNPDTADSVEITDLRFFDDASAEIGGSGGGGGGTVRSQAFFW